MVTTLLGPTVQVSIMVHSSMLATFLDTRFIIKNLKLQVCHADYSCFQLFFLNAYWSFQGFFALQALHRDCYNITNVSPRPNVFYYSYFPLLTWKLSYHNFATNQLRDVQVWGSVLDPNQMIVVRKVHCLATIKNLSIQVGRFNKNFLLFLVGWP